MDKVEILLLVIVCIAIFNCLVRSDYNVVIALICYFYWNSRQAKVQRVALIIYVILAFVTLFDILWLIIFWHSWTGENWASAIWNQLRFWHVFVVITSIVNMVLKVLAGYLVYSETKNELPYQALKENIFKADIRQY